MQNLTLLNIPNGAEELQHYHNFQLSPLSAKASEQKTTPDYDIFVGMTRVCRNVTNQVTLELVVEAMHHAYSCKKMHILTEKL